MVLFDRVAFRRHQGLSIAWMLGLMVLAGPGLGQSRPPPRPAAPAVTATAGSTFDVIATVRGAASALWLDLALTPLPADVGKVGKVYVGALIPVPGTEGAWFLLDDRGRWIRWTGGAMAPHSSGTLPSRVTVPVSQGLDVRGLQGAALYMGYGKDADDMLARGLVKQGYRIDLNQLTPPAFTLMTNPTDSSLLSVRSGDGTQVQYFGSRSDLGIPGVLRRAEVVAPDGGLTRIEFDADLRPQRLRSANGSVFDLSYDSATQAQVQVTSGDGSVQLSTAFPLGRSPASGAPAAGSRLDAARSRARASAAPSDWTIQVSKCGLPHDEAEVTYTIQVPGQFIHAGAGMAVGAGGGRYVASIPTGLRPSLAYENLRAAAESLADGLGKACDVLSLSGHPEVYLAGLCPYIGGLLTSVTGAGGVAIGQACTAVTAAVASYCKVLGEGGVINEPSLAEKILAGLKDPKVFQSLITLRADAWVKGALGSYTTQRVDVPANGPHPTAAIAIEDGCGELSTTVYPVTQSAGIEYLANPYLRGFGIKAEVFVSAGSVARKYPDEPCCSTWWQVGGPEFRVRLRDLQVDTSLFPFKSTLMGGDYLIHDSASFVRVTGVHKCDGAPWVDFTGTEVTLPVGGSCTVTFVVNMKEAQTRYDSDGAKIESGVYATGLAIHVEVNR